MKCYEKHPHRSRNRILPQTVKCLGTWSPCWTGCSVCPLSKPFIRQGQVGCGPRMWAIVVGHRKPWMSGGSHPPAQELCVAAMWRLQPRPKHAYCAGLKGHYNPSPHVPAPPSNLYSSLAVFASLQSAFNTVRCHAASHKLKRDGGLSLSFSVVKTCASQHAAGLLSRPESADQCKSVCPYGGRCFFIISHVCHALQK